MSSFAASSRKALDGFRWLPFWLASLLLLIPAVAAQGALDDSGAWVPTARVVNPNDAPVSSGQFCQFGENAFCGNSRSDFGSAVALGNGAAVVGSPHSSTIHFYEQTGIAWLLSGSFTGPAGFGTSVAISDGTAVIGAPGASEAQIFQSKEGAWSATSTLRGASGGCFGAAVDTDGGQVVVGDPCASQAHVYDDATNWSEIGILSSSGSAGLGRAVALAGGSVLLASSNNVVAFETIGGAWSAATIAMWGTSTLAMDGDHAAIPANGEVHMMERHPEGWKQVGLLQPDDASPFRGQERFGWAVALRGDTLVVGAFEDDASFAMPNSPNTEAQPCISEVGICPMPRPGAAYVFTQEDGAWSQAAKLTTDVAGDHRFGWSVAIGGGERTIAVGAPNSWFSSLATVVDVDPEDSVHVFTRGGY